VRFNSHEVLSRHFYSVSEVEVDKCFLTRRKYPNSRRMQSSTVTISGIYERATNLEFHQSHVAQEGHFTFTLPHLLACSQVRPIVKVKQKRQEPPTFLMIPALWFILQINRFVTPANCEALETIMTACHALCAIRSVKAVVDCGYIYIPALLFM